MRTLSTLLMLVFLLPISCFAQEASIADKNEAKGVFGDWKVTCKENENCRMAQSVINKTTGQAVVQLRIFKEPKPTALFSFPLGILLNTGWQLRVDNGKAHLLPFEICREDGCHAGINLTEPLTNSMKRGSKLNVRFHDSQQNPVDIELSLKGFTDAYEALHLTGARK